MSRQPAWRRVYERVCDQCGAEFVTPYSRKIRCSWACVERYQRRQTAAAYQRRRAAMAAAAVASEG